MHRIIFLFSVLLPAIFGPTTHASSIHAGLARVDISPAEAVPLMGYASRANLPRSPEVAQRIYARALALGEGEQTAVLMTIDNCILPGAITAEVRRRLSGKLKLRPERITLTVTHTHSAPCLSGAAPNIFGAEITASDHAAIDAYTRFFIEQVEKVAVAALADRRPAELAWGKGEAGFAKNRRTAGGPVDHDLPLLRVASADGKVRAVFVTYACHCTTLGGEFNAVHGDWAGVAAEAIERDHPGAIALVAIGCGADANPEPRGSLELAKKHGEEIATETKRLLTSRLQALTGMPECRLKEIELPFEAAFSREEWERRAATSGIVGYHARKWLARLDKGDAPPATLLYPVQTWTFADQLALIFLGGEVVVDYSLRLKRELDATRLWVNAYSNDVPCYIPSRRILSEGGYEAESSLWYYDRPQRLAPAIEDLIVGTVRDLLPKSFAAKPPSEVPPPRSPALAAETFRTRPGFEIKLVASEPLIESPVAIDFAADGRLWVCEMRDYPTGMDGQGKPGGRVKVLTDTDGNGEYDAADVWADDLPFPTGLMAWRDGVMVCAAPDVWLLTPADAGRSAIRREKLLSGFGTENFQARVSGLRWGLDGWVHGSGGLFGGKVTVHKTGKTVDCTNRDFRFHPDTGAFEPLAGVSQQGHVRDDFDQWFGNDNSTLLGHFPLPDRYRRRNPHYSGPAPHVARFRDSDAARVFPVSNTLERFNDPESANRLTSACGPEIYRDDLLGKAFAGNAFVCEPVHNLVRRAVLQPEDVTFASRRSEDEQRSEFLASTDNWFRPVEVRTGPDGALWIVDMYRFVVEHPRWIPADRLRQLEVRAGAEKGRIWRLFSADAPPRPIRDLTKLSFADLAAVSESPNGVERDLAHRLIAGQAALFPDAQVVEQLERTAIQSERAASRVQALAVLQQIDRLSETRLVASLHDHDPRVRRFAITLCEPRSPSAGTPSLRPPVLDALLALIRDSDPGVRYQLALTLGEFPDEAAGRALAQIAARDGTKEWPRAAILSSMLGAPRSFTRSLVALTQPTREFTALRSSVLTTLVSECLHEAVGDWLTVTFPVDSKPLPNSTLPEALQLLAALSAEREVADRLASNGDSPAARSLARLRRELEHSAARLAADETFPEPTRAAALQLLAERASQNSDHLRELLSMVDLKMSEPLRRSWIAGLQRQRDPEVGRRLLEGWPRRSPAQRLMLLPILLSQKNWTDEVLTCLEHGAVTTAELSAAQREHLRKHPNVAIRNRAEKLLPPATSDRAVVLSQFAKVADLPGDASRGVAHFDRLCASCHALRGHGHAVGPDLAIFRAKPIADFLTAILDPNAAVEPRFVAWIAELKSGRMALGVVRDESTATVTLVQPGGTSDTVQRSQIQRLTPAPASLMPVGLEEGLTPKDLADLIAWMKSE